MSTATQIRVINGPTAPDLIRQLDDIARGLGWSERPAVELTFLIEVAGVQRRVTAKVLINAVFGEEAFGKNWSFRGHIREGWAELRDVFPSMCFTVRDYDRMHRRSFIVLPTAAGI